MQRVYQDTDRATIAYLVSELERMGIEAEVFEPYQTSDRTVFEIQVSEESASRADEVIRSVMEAEPEPKPDANSGTEARKRPSSRWTPFLAGAVVGCIVGGALMFDLANRWFDRPPEGTSAFDADGDGKPDAWYDYHDGSLVAIRRDLNSDGKPDAWESYESDRVSKDTKDTDFNGAPDLWYEYDGRGHTKSGRLDVNGDGRPDEWLEFEGELTRKSTADLNYDGLPDEWVIYQGGKPVEAQWSLDFDGKIQKKAYYRSGIRSRELFDRDRDGRFEEEQELDVFGDPVRRVSR